MDQFVFSLVYYLRRTTKRGRPDVIYNFIVHKLKTNEESDVSYFIRCMRKSGSNPRFNMGAFFNYSKEKYLIDKETEIYIHTVPKTEHKGTKHYIVKNQLFTYIKNRVD